jgi:tetratricopeptide (TPR) repeat protein
LKHPRAIILVAAYARSLAAQQRPEEAVKLYDDLIEARRQSHGDEHPLTADGWVLKAVSLWVRDPAEAERLCRKALAVYRTRERNRSNYRTVCNWMLGKILLNRRRAAEAWTYLEEACTLELDRRADSLEVLASLLDALLDAGRRRNEPAAAEPLFRQAWSLVSRYPHDRYRTRIAELYAELLRQTGRGAEVEQLLGIRPEQGMVEGEDLVEKSKKTSGEADRQYMRDWRDHWSGAYQLWWHSQARGATLTLKLPARAGQYDVTARFTKAHDYGIAKLSIDGKKLRDINLFHHCVIPSSPERLGPVELLGDGQHVLTIQMIDADKKSRGNRYGFGLDWIKLTPTGPAR